MKHIKIGELLGMLFLLAIGLLACHSDQKERTKSDSDLTAPVDTLGGDTTRQSPLADTATAATAQNK